MMITPVRLGRLAPTRRSPLPTEIGWRELARGTAICLGAVAVLATAVASLDTRPPAALQISDPAMMSAAKPAGKFGH